MEKAKGGPPFSVNPSPETRDWQGAPTLSDLGISYDQSSKWQRLAAVPEEQFEAALAGSEGPTIGSPAKQTAIGCLPCS
jgi:hypothetical protein